jgi:hypothetical protein
MSALPQRAVMRRVGSDVRLVPTTDIGDARNLRQLNRRFDPGCYRVQHLGSDLGIPAPSTRGYMKRMIGIVKQLESRPRAELLDEHL